MWNRFTSLWWCWRNSFVTNRSLAARLIVDYEIASGYSLREDWTKRFISWVLQTKPLVSEKENLGILTCFPTECLKGNYDFMKDFWNDLEILELDMDRMLTMDKVHYAAFLQWMTETRMAAIEADRLKKEKEEAERLERIRLEKEEAERLERKRIEDFKKQEIVKKEILDNL